MSTVVPPPSQTRRKSVHPFRRHSDQCLGGYSDPQGLQREIVSLLTPCGTTLVVDRLSASLDDPRLVAHLSADEPVENAQIVADLYLADEGGRRCRALKCEDLQSEPLYDETGGATCADPCGDGDASELVDSDGSTYRLGLVHSQSSSASLRWLKRVAGEEGCEQPVTVREVVGALESYEPPRTLTARAIEVLDEDPGVSAFTLRAELVRLSMSPIVLNRGLRKLVLTAVERGELSLSEIAIRCGRLKRDARGNESGETSWLARRIGTMPEHGRDSPTRWVHSDVLALIARSGLGVAPREVEVG
jgi:hypothetical protein